VHLLVSELPDFIVTPTGFDHQTAIVRNIIFSHQRKLQKVLH